jgi:hypothetical protein
MGFLERQNKLVANQRYIQREYKNIYPEINGITFTSNMGGTVMLVTYKTKVLLPCCFVTVT